MFSRFQITTLQIADFQKTTSLTSLALPENDIFIIGFYFSAGKAADGPTHTLEKNDLREAPESSIQRRLLDLGQSSLFLNLSAIDDGSEKFEWVFNPLPSWSKFKYPYYQAEEILINKYDGLTWFKNITSSDYIDVMYLWDDW
ncbi:MAG: hypothetical protein AAFN65_05230 [Bacteroidota bacterium]